MGDLPIACCFHRDMATVRDIPFRSIPRQSTLFLDYLDLSPTALRFYQHAPTMEGLEYAARGKLATLQFPRKAVASILRRQNARYGGDSETLRRIGELESPDSVAVLTGQQVGLFTGPLYTVYKALTAMHISEELNKRGIKAVPIFWMDTEDHDLPEVTRRTVLDSRMSVQVLDYREALFRENEMPMRSVGSLPFADSIRDVVTSFLSHLPDSVWKPEVQSRLQLTYKPGATFALSFAQLMLQILRGSGLILFDPLDTEAKQLTAGVFQKALRDADAIHAALVHRNRELDAAGFHAQVSVLENSTLLFLNADGERRALERRNSNFGLRHTDRGFALEELLKCAEQTPERFSPNVLFRPLIQDHLFPTLAYVGGSSELSYFAQAEVLYTLLDRPMPVIWPRNSFTLLEPEIAAEMDRFGIEIQDCFQGRRFVLEKAVRKSGLSKVAVRLEALQGHLDQVLTEIRPEMQAIESPLVHALETARRKILHNAQRLKSQVVSLEEQQNSPVSNAVDLLLSHCVPNGNLQERELNLQHFLARHGPSLLDTIHSATEIGNFAHRVLRLENNHGETKD
jgi:bacillithiol biosynthesis cysteine-adding enzyme BshC